MPQTPMGELTALPDPLAGINNKGDLLLRAGESAGGKRRRGGKGKGRAADGKGGERIERGKGSGGDRRVYL